MRQDPRAKDVLGELPARRVLGAGLSGRVGARRWERAPVVCCSRRIFARCAVTDPWDPEAEERPVAVGPVGVKFEERRQPAPHARVKETKKAEKPAWTPPAGIAEAKPRSPPPRPATAAPRPQGPKEPPSGPPPQRPPVPSAEGRAPRAPKPAGPAPRVTSGRFRMQPVSTAGPRVRSLTPPPAILTAQLEEAPPGSAAPPDDGPRSPAAGAAPAAAQPQTLDDLFGNLGTAGRDRRVGRPSTKPRGPA